MITNTQLNATDTAICTSGASEQRAVLVIVFCNLDVATRIITVYAKPSGGSAGDTTTIIKDLAIPAGDSYIWSAGEKFILDANESISGLADVASKITATTSYMVL